MEEDEEEWLRRYKELSNKEVINYTELYKGPTFNDSLFHNNESTYYMNYSPEQTQRREEKEEELFETMLRNGSMSRVETLANFQHYKKVQLNPDVFELSQLLLQSLTPREMEDLKVLSATSQLDFEIIKNFVLDWFVNDYRCHFYKQWNEQASDALKVQSRTRIITIESLQNKFSKDRTNLIKLFPSFLEEQVKKDVVAFKSVRDKITSVPEEVKRANKAAIATHITILKTEYYSQGRYNDRSQLIDTVITFLDDLVKRSQQTPERPIRRPTQKATPPNKSKLSFKVTTAAQEEEEEKKRMDDEEANKKLKLEEELKLMKAFLNGTVPVPEADPET
jgi:hypothetical protein